MKLMNTAREFWHNLEAFAYALEHDPYADILSRIERLEHDGRSRQARLTALSDDVLNLSEQVAGGSRPAL